MGVKFTLTVFKTLWLRGSWRPLLLSWLRRSARHIQITKATCRNCKSNLNTTQESSKKKNRSYVTQGRRASCDLQQYLQGGIKALEEFYEPRLVSLLKRREATTDALSKAKEQCQELRAQLGPLREEEQTADTPENLSGGEDATNGEPEMGKYGTISGESFSLTLANCHFSYWMFNVLHSGHSRCLRGEYQRTENWAQDPDKEDRRIGYSEEQHSQRAFPLQASADTSSKRFWFLTAK